MRAQSTSPNDEITIGIVGCGGQLLDWVGHHVDIALWTLGLDRTGPVKVEGTGKHGNDTFFNTYIKQQPHGVPGDR